jgi:DNA-binding response OmpR family regulator
LTHSNRGAGRILLVDDLSLFRRMLPARLGSMGAWVESAANVDEARAYLARFRPDLILLDVVMPGVDGFAYCRELKADPKLRDIPVVMLTDLTTNARDRSLEAGADDYMPKRIDDSVMRIRVSLHLNLADLRRKAPGSTFAPEPARIVLASASPGLKAQLPAQFSQDGHLTRIVEGLDGLAAAIQPDDRLLVIDLELGIDAIHPALGELRMDPATARLPVLVLGTREQFAQLRDIEAMVDDVLWKPLNAQVNRQRLVSLLELGHRSKDEAPTGV